MPRNKTRDTSVPQAFVECFAGVDVVGDCVVHLVAFLVSVRVSRPERTRARAGTDCLGVDFFHGG